MKTGTENLKLPYKNPSIKTYPYFTNLVGILEAYDSANEWIYNNHILLWMYKDKHFSSYVANFKYSDNICQLIDEKLLCKNIVLSHYACLLDFIKYAINSQQYILVPLNLYYINEWWSDMEENRFHFCHPMLINGYDFETKAIYVSDFWRSGYGTISIPFDLFETAAVGRDTNDISENKITLLKFNGQSLDIDICRIKGLIEDFLNADDTYMPCCLLRENKKEDIAYGIEYYDELLKYLDIVKSAKKYSRIDIRKIHLIVELNMIMQGRINYLTINKYIHKDALLVDLIGKLISKSLLAQNIALKYNVAKNVKLLAQLYDHIIELKALQNVTFEKCLQALN